MGWIVFFLEEKLNGWQMAKLGMKPDWSWGILIYLGCGKTLEDLDFPEYKYIYIYTIWLFNIAVENPYFSWGF